MLYNKIQPFNAFYVHFKQSRQLIISSDYDLVDTCLEMKEKPVLWQRRGIITKILNVSKIIVGGWLKSIAPDWWPSSISHEKWTPKSFYRCSKIKHKGSLHHLTRNVSNLENYIFTNTGNNLETQDPRISSC